MKLVAVFIIILVIALPFGFWRAYTSKFSIRWFLSIHLPVPLDILVRVESDLSYKFIPLTLAAFLAGQFLGSFAGRWWIRRRVGFRAPGYPPDGETAPPQHAAQKEDGR